MQRCAPLRLVLTALTLTPGAQAQAPRHFPADALRGELQFGQPPELLVNGRPARLALGARIRGENNFIELSGGLTGRKAVANYTLDNAGAVKDVWLLRADERARKPWPASPAEAAAWRFDAAGQTWSKP